MYRPPPSSFNVARLAHHRRKRRARKIGFPLAVLAGAGVLGVGIGVAPVILPADAAASVAYEERLADCRITDGDTIRCGGERIRLLGIDAPELPDHCRPGRVCAPGDPYASSQSLGMALTPPLTIRRIGEDHYGRTLALVAGKMGDMSCWQLRQHQVIYKPQWDDGLRVARTCPRAIM